MDAHQDPHPAQTGSHPPVDHHHVSKHVRLYLGVGAALLVCTGLTVGLSFVNFGTPKANIIVAMILAAFKASLVAAIFMHLTSEKWTIYRFLLLTVFFVIGLFVLSLLAFHDPIQLHYSN